MRVFMSLLLAAFLFVGCNKVDKCPFWDAPATAPEVEVTRLRDKLNTLGVPYTEASEGYFYHIVNPGDGRNPNICSTVRFNYIGSIVNGPEFERSTGNGISLILGQLIVGMNKGMQRIKPGGSMKLYIPPFLGLGYEDKTSGTTVIPAESDLVYEVSLISVD